jgi:hypothetical protein
MNYDDLRDDNSFDLQGYLDFFSEEEEAQSVAAGSSSGILQQTNRDNSYSNAAGIEDLVAQHGPEIAPSSFPNNDASGPSSWPENGMLSWHMPGIYNRASSGSEDLVAQHGPEIAPSSSPNNDASGPSSRPENGTQSWHMPGNDNRASSGSEARKPAVAPNVSTDIPQAAASPTTSTPNAQDSASQEMQPALNAQDFTSQEMQPDTGEDARVFWSRNLPGLINDTVPVHDSCDEVRRNILEHFEQNPNLTKTAFLLTLARQLSDLGPGRRHNSIKTGPDWKFNLNRLDNFLMHTGSDRGNVNPVYYGAYVYFERLRILKREPKSKHRLEMEEIWPLGMPLSRQGPSRRSLRTGTHHLVKVDEYGRVWRDDVAQYHTW